MTSPRRKEQIAEICDWITHHGVVGTPFDTLIEPFCERLLTAGLPILRANLSMRAQHPTVGGFAYRWQRKTGFLHEEYVRDPNIQTGWDNSPLKTLVESDQTELRRRIAPELRPFEFPMLEDMLAQGATDYFAQQLSFTDQTRNAPGDVTDPVTSAMGLLASWTTDHPDGFSPTDISDLRVLLPVMGARAEIKRQLPHGSRSLRSLSGQ